MKVYAQQNDNVDAILYRTFGTSYDGLLEETLLLNPHLTNQPILAIGTVVELPDSKPQASVKKDSIKLWE